MGQTVSDFLTCERGPFASFLDKSIQRERERERERRWSRRRSPDNGGGGDTSHPFRYVKLTRDQDAPAEEIRPGELNQPVHVPQLQEVNCSRNLDAPFWVDVKFQAVKSPCLIWSSVYQKQPSQQLSVLFIHMPRIVNQGGSQRSEWYTIERLLRKYSSLHGIDIFVYYFQRSSRKVPDSN
ncbi:hypothetical protein ACP70R_050303 [Stipagrostis hirtigluma subsp. patula]